MLTLAFYIIISIIVVAIFSILLEYGKYFILAIIAICVIVKLIRWGRDKYVNLADYNIDSMDGVQFERFCVALLSQSGFRDIHTTPKHGDHGVDIIAWHDGEKWVFQCKRYSKNVGNRAIQEVYSGKAIYGADVATVITNRFFTKQAKNDAERLNVLLWDRSDIQSMIKRTVKKRHKTQHIASRRA